MPGRTASVTTLLSMVPSRRTGCVVMANFQPPSWDAGKRNIVAASEPRRSAIGAIAASTPILSKRCSRELIVEGPGPSCMGSSTNMS